MNEQPPQRRFGRFSGVDEAWLAKRPREAVIEPELPIIDAHHHLWDRPHIATAARTAGRHGHRPQHDRHRLRPVPLDVPRRRAGGDAPGRRDRIRRRHRRDERQRRLRPDAGRRRHRRLRRPDAGRARRSRCWRRMSAPAAGASAACGIPPPGMPTRSSATAIAAPRPAVAAGLSRRAGAADGARPSLDAWVFHPSSPT